jgi:hypothetical protein
MGFTEWVPVGSAIGTSYSEQGKGITYSGLIVPEANATSFMVAENSAGALTPYAKDNKNVYVYGRRISNADPVTFSVVFNSKGQFTSFSKDQFHVFTVGNIEYTGTATVLPNVDPQSFVYLNDFYIKDNEHVFDQIGNIINGAQPTTINVMGLDSFYAKDSSQVYDVLDGFSEYAVPQAQPASFFAFGAPQSCGHDCYYDAQDARHKFLNGRIVSY